MRVKSKCKNKNKKKKVLSLLSLHGLHGLRSAGVDVVAPPSQLGWLNS